MTRRAAIVVVALAASVAAGCGYFRTKPLTAHDIAGHVVLESYEVDVSWGYRMRGIYIDGNGDVWSYDQTGTPWYPERVKPGEISARDMLEKHKHATQIGSVDPRGVLDMAQLIHPASEGNIVRSKALNLSNGRLDVAYQYDAGTPPLYKEIILAGTGDMAATNSSSAAQSLLDYLRDVERSVGWNW